MTAAQLKAMGPVDLAIAQLSNSFSSMTVANRKGVNLMNQVHPRTLVVTHMIEDPVATLKMAAATWKTTWTPKAWIAFTPGMLPADTTVVFIGNDARVDGKIAGASVSDW